MTYDLVRRKIALEAWPANGAAVVAAHDARLASVRELTHKATGAYSEELTGMLTIGGSAGAEASALDITEGYSLFANDGVEVTTIPCASLSPARLTL